jgi:hypothetical protein
MKERPIIFSGEMVQSTLEGRMTMTIRVVNLGKFRGADVDKCVPSIDGLFVPSDGIVFSTPSTRFSKAMQDKIVRCPFGVPGDREEKNRMSLLWVKETWATESHFDNLRPKNIPSLAKIWYMADGPKPIWVGKTRPSIFMVRWMSRITLEITNIRVERLTEITDKDVLREGVDLNPWVWCISFRRLP